MNTPIHADKAESLADLAVSTSSVASPASTSDAAIGNGAASTVGERPLAPSGNPARPLRYSLDVYWRAPSDGPLHFTWSDKPHRVVYDLVSGYAFLRASHERLEQALIGLLPVTFTGNPTREEEVAHWTRERELGNGNAQAVLDAYAALAAIPKELAS